MDMTPSPGTGTPKGLACPVFVSTLESCWVPKRGPHMVSSVPEGDSRSPLPPTVR
jgi:hypothetical protein